MKDSPVNMILRIQEQIKSLVPIAVSAKEEVITNDSL